MSTGPHVSINAETLFSFGGFHVSNSIFTSLIISALIILFALIVRFRLTDTTEPKGLQNFAEWLVESLYSMVYSVAGNVKKSRVFFPFVATFFIFIILNNWFGLLPGVGTIGFRSKTHKTEVIVEKETEVKEIKKVEAGQGNTLEKIQIKEKPTTEKIKVKGEKQSSEFVPFFRPGTSDLNTTFALALFSVAVVQLIGIKFSKLAYFKKFINFSNPIMFFVGILETISELAKVISFSFRLFGNIFAGEVLLAVMAFLMPLLMPVPFYGLEVFVGFIQALVFAMLSLVFFNMAAEQHQH